jgi:hypothetical protein
LISKRNAVGDTPEHTSVYYIAKLSQINGNVIPAATPVVLRSSGDAEIKLRPVGKPEHTAVETSDLSQMVLFLKQLLKEKLHLDETESHAPSPKAIS